MPSYRTRQSRWLFQVLVFTALTDAVEVPASDSTSTTVSWSSPNAGDAFNPGETLVAAWESPQKIISPSFTLCADGEDGEQCGEPVWPRIAEDQSTYSIAIVVPNITLDGSFYLKMKSDLGDYYSSPDFELAAISDKNASNPAVIAVPSSLAAAANVTRQGDSSTSSANPSLESLDPRLHPQNTPRSPNPLAIGIPLTMLGMALLGAFAFFITKRTSNQSTGPTNSALAPGKSSSGSQLSGAKSPGIKCNESAEKTFFNITLNKTDSELSEVEKAVVGAINTSTVAAAPDTQRQTRSAQSDSGTTSQPYRQRRVQEDGYYTRAPPRTWHRRGREGDESNSWQGEHLSYSVAGEPQGHSLRASSRECDYDYDWDWGYPAQPNSVSRREPLDVYDWPRRSRADYYRPPLRDRWEEGRIDPDRHYSSHYVAGSRHHQEIYSPSQIRPPLRHQEPSRTSLSSSDARYRPQSVAPSLPNPYMRGGNTNPGPEHMRSHVYSSSGVSPGVIDGDRPPESLPGISVPMHNDQHSSFSVISAYLTPSPYLTSSSGFLSTPYMGTEEDRAVQPTRRTSSTEPPYPPGLR